MSEKPNALTLPSALLWRHFNWHLWRGLALWSCCAGPFVFYQYWLQRVQVLAEPFYADHRAEALAGVADEFLGLGLMLFFGTFVVALISSCLRYPFLAALCRQAHTRMGLVVRSLLLFELTIFLLAIPPWPIAYNRFGLASISRQLLLLSLFSLPWLITTGVASYRLAAALLLPPTGK